MAKFHIVLGASVGLISDKYGYTSNDNSLFGAIVIISGLTGSFIHAILLDKFKKFKLQYILVGIFTIVSIVFLILVLDLKIIWLTGVALGGVGGSVVPVIGVGYSFCAEMAFPVGESTSGGLMQIISSIFSTLIGLGFNFMLDKMDGTPALASLGSCVVIGWVTSLFVVEKLNKTNLKYRLSASSFSIALVPVEEEEEAPDLKEEYLNGKPETFENKGLLEKSD